MEPFVPVPSQGPASSGALLLPADSVDALDEPDSVPVLPWTRRKIDLDTQPSVPQGSPASSSSPPRTKEPSPGQMFAELNSRVPTILSVPMTYTVGGLVLAAPQWWSLNSAVCEGGLPLSIAHTVAVFEGLAWPTSGNEQKAMVKRVSRVSSLAAMNGYSPFGAVQANKITGRTLWLCYVVQSIEFRPNPAVRPPSMKGPIIAWNPSTFGARLWHFYSSRVCVGGLSAYLNASEVMFANRAIGSVVDRMSFHHHSSYVVGAPPVRALAGVTESTDLQEGDGTTMHVWTWLVVKNQTWQSQARLDTTRVQMSETRRHLEHALARSLAGDPYDVTVGMIVTTRCALEAPLPLALWGVAMCASATMATDSKVALLRGSSIRRVIVTLSDGRSVDVEILKMILMVGAEFPTIGEAPT